MTHPVTRDTHSHGSLLTKGGSFYEKDKNENQVQ